MKASEQSARHFFIFIFSDNGKLPDEMGAARPCYPPAPTAYKPVYQPWSAGWRNYCASKYRSFNPRTGT
ncbi:MULTISPECIES: BA14K family protein [Bartonella]|uniref:BA14K family protein n=1 Tax=Bartonella TaxID=773 RepID=UPI001FF06802|nr:MULTISPECIES: BA14K family protein [Bartonella]